jgi:hypothetical protein
VMMNKKINSKCCYSVANEVGSMIVGQTPWTSKEGNDILKNEPSSCIHRIVMYWCCYNPMSKVVSCSNDVHFLRMFGYGFNGPNDINCPFLKFL